jgi:hypothetical protein
MISYQFSMEIKLGHQNAVVDALPHYEEDTMTIHSLSLPEFEMFDQFRQESTSLLKIVAKRVKIEVGKANAAWSIVNDMVVHADRLFIPASLKFWTPVLEHAHDMGHEGIQKMLQRLRTSSFDLQDNNLVCEFHSRVLYLSTEQNRASSSDGTSSTTRCAERCLDRHHHGLCRGVSQGRQQIGDLDSR